MNSVGLPPSHALISLCPRSVLRSARSSAETSARYAKGMARQEPYRAPWRKFMGRGCSRATLCIATRNSPALRLRRACRTPRLAHRSFSEGGARRPYRSQRLSKFDLRPAGAWGNAVFTAPARAAGMAADEARLPFPDTKVQKVRTPAFRRPEGPQSQRQMESCVEPSAKNNKCKK